MRSTQNIEEVRVYNSFGVEVYRSDMFDGTEAQLYLQDLSAGTYFIHCGQGNGIVGVEKLVLYR
ncbi:MAG: T9SS type A sorting domain-containing protein [Flavobacteriales bacterium]|nr:T9SS type A sorting domain-containing protein [Flavobacteriales bacterium]